VSTRLLRSGLCGSLAAVLVMATVAHGDAVAQPKPASTAKGAAGASSGKSGASAPSSKGATSAAGTSSAAATTATPVAPEAPKDDADAWFAKGAAAQEAGRSAEAEELFLKVWAVKKAWDVAANLGLAQVNLGKHVEAAEHLTYALRWFPVSEPAATKAVLERRLAAAKAEVGTLQVTVSVEGAQVKVNGVAKGASPIEGEVFVAPGAVTIEVEKDGYEAVRRTLDVAKGGSETASLVLVPKVAPERSKVPAFVIGGVGLAGVALGAGLLVASRDKYDATQKIADDIRAQKKSCVGGAGNFDPRCTSVADDGRTVNVLRDAAIVSFAVAGVAAAGVTLYLLWPAAKPGIGAVRMTVTATDTSAGIVARGRF